MSLFMIIFYHISTLKSLIGSIFPSKSSSTPPTEFDISSAPHSSSFDDIPSNTLSPTIPPPELPPIIRSSRTRNPPSHLNDFVFHVSNQSSSLHPSTDFTSYPITNSLSYDKLSNQHLQFVLSLQTHT